MKFLWVHALIVCFFFEAKSDPDYYWRPYFGNIPDDAVPGGSDISGQVTYIGQSFVLNHGILIGQIIPGTKSITTSKEGIHVSSVDNKILCSINKSKFKWKRANSRTLQVTTLGEHLVVGGTEWGKALNIGRIKYQGNVVIGKICSGVVGEAKMYFPYNGNEIETEDYEVLVYENNLNVEDVLIV